MQNIVNACKKIESFLLDSPHFAIFFSFGIIVTYDLGSAFVDPDLFARVAMGRLAVLFREVPQNDPFSFSVFPHSSIQPPWIDHEWLSGLVFYELSQYGGDWALLIFKWSLALVSAFLLAEPQKSTGETRNFFVFFVPVLFLLSYLWRSTIRAQVFTYLFLPYVLLCIHVVLTKGKVRSLLAFPLLFAVWANCHGGFVLGLLFLGGAAGYDLIRGGAARKKLVCCFAFCLVATLCNPYGLAYWRFIIHALGMARPSITEWASVELFSPVGGLLVVYAWVVGIASWRGVLSWYERGVFAVTFVLAFLHLRLAAVFFMPVLIFGGPAFLLACEWVGSLLGRFSKPARFGLALAVFFAAITLGHRSVEAVQTESFGRLSLKGYPVKAIELLRLSELRGRLLVDFNNGSFALWRLFPKFLVSLDGRYEEVYPEAVFDQVRCALDVNCPAMLESIEVLRPSVILYALPNGRREYEARLANTWHKIYEDTTAVVFVPVSSLPVTLPELDPKFDLELQSRYGWKLTW